ncbi:hypothetical protein D9611_006864 [Ephemerocybe angulata]|uniref:Uncharacterized protein n=1 Tax=Ephemerocybe angulata TaxID=980116 RepID=A0A8H5AZH3_9AGAR|nr:hypothetical protein D9611_006864 [Tulosesus angulatus]
MNYHRQLQQSPQYMYVAYPTQQPQYTEGYYVDEAVQGQQAMGYVDPFYDVASSMQPPPPPTVPEMIQPSPVVHAPIPISNARFTGTSSYYGTHDSGTFQPTSPLYYDYSEPTHHDNVASGMAQAWDEVPTQPYLGPTFPTPSQLLIDLGGTDDAAAAIAQQEALDLSSMAYRASFSASPEVGASTDDSASVSESAAGTDSAVSSQSSRPTSRISSRSASSVLPDTPQQQSETISSHEKKRHYLECLEQYVLYLHNQFSLLGVQPPPLTRVDSYKGLNSRSIRWLQLCKTFIAQNPTMASDEDIARQISNSVLVLYQSYPADPSLNSYMKHAIDDGTLPLSIYVSTFLEAFDSSDNSWATLDFLCELAVTLHEESGHLPMGSLVSVNEDPLNILLNVGHCLSLIQRSHHTNLPPRHHKIAQNSGKLLVHLLSCATDLSLLTNTEAVKQSYAANAILREPQVDMRVRVALDSYSINLRMIVDDMPKGEREAQMLQSMQLEKGDIGGPNSENDIVSLGLLLQHLVTQRGHDFGAGHTMHAVALLVSTWRCSSWPAQVFYTQLFVSAFSCLSSELGSPAIWKAFIVGRLPVLLAAFQTAVSSDQSVTVDWRGAFQHGIRAAMRRPDLIIAGDSFLTRGTNKANVPTEAPPYSYTHELLQQLVKADLIDQGLAIELDPSLANQNGSQGFGAYFDGATLDNSGVDATTLEFKFGQDMESADGTWFDRVVRDVSVHALFANLVLKRFSAAAKTLDVEALSHLCKLMYTHPFALDLLALHVKLSDLVFYSLLFLEEYDCETVGDPQTAVGHLGNVVLNPTPATLEILQTLLLSPSCPTPVRALCRTSVLRYLADKNKGIPGCPNFKVSAVQAAVRGGPAPGTVTKPASVAPVAPASGLGHPIGPPASDLWYNYPSDKLRAAMQISQTHKLVDLDVDRCLHITNPTRFLQALWNIMSIATLGRVDPTGGLEVCRRVATYVLTTPLRNVHIPEAAVAGEGGQPVPRQNPSAPPLLPIFMHLLLPSLFTPIDRSMSSPHPGVPDQTPLIELITSIIFSALTAALHLEWALATGLKQAAANSGAAGVKAPEGSVLGESSSSVARRLAADLRARKDSRLCGLILQRLASSPGFVANFPYFGSGIES